MSKPTIFISYSHKDEAWKDRVVTQLGVSQQFELWDDRRIAGGDDWHEAIIQAIERGAVAVLLISANSLTSEYILRHEVPRFLQLHREGLMRIFPILISSLDYEAVPWLKAMNLRPRDARALNRFPDAEIDLQLAAIAKEIRLLLQAPAQSAAQAADSPYRREPTLPAPKPFVGRASHLIEIERRLRSGAVGPICLKGTAGVGKSALALEAAYRFGALFPGGRYWVDLRVGDAAHAVRALLRNLGAADRVAPDSLLPELCQVARIELAERPALVILDNAETLEAGDRESLLDLCAATIITSRIAIDPTTDIPVDTLPPDDALALLRERGVNVEAERDDALRLIERLGGLALAMEITARRMASYRPQQRCADALDELNRERHLVEAIRLPRGARREDNIAEAFALSYRKLDLELQTAFHALGLCAESGAPLDGIARLLGQPPHAVRDLLLVLADWSLADFSGQRAVLHPLLHSYAELCARQAPERSAMMIVEHVRYFGHEIGGSYQQAIDADNPEQDLKLPLIDREIENVILAQIRSLEHGFADSELAVEVMYGLKYYWQLRNETRVLEWLHLARNLSRHTGQTDPEGYLLKAIGDVQSFRDEKDAALSSYLEAQSLFKQVGSNLGQANVLQAIGDVQSFRDEKDAALSSYLEAQSLFKQVGSNLGQANVLQAIGDVQSFRDEKDAALSSYLEAQSLFKQVGSNLGQANVLQAIGDVQSFRDEKDAALSSYLEAQSLFKQVGSNLGQANVLLALGRVNDDPESFERALALYQQIGDRYSTARCQYFFGLSRKEAGDGERARQLLVEAREGWAVSYPPGVEFIDEELAELDGASGQD